MIDYSEFLRCHASVGGLMPKLIVTMLVVVSFAAGILAGIGLGIRVVPDGPQPCKCGPSCPCVEAK